MLSSYSVTNEGDIPLESITLSFTKLLMKYIPYDKNGKPQSSIPAGYGCRYERLILIM